MSKPLRWGICTAGAIAHDFASSLIGHEDDHALVAVAARSLDRATKFADELKIPTAYGSYAELATDPSIDIVYVASINTEHHAQCKLFMEHKKHVLCEKPTSLTLRDTQDILKSAKQNGVFFMEGYWTTFFPACKVIRDTISSGELGDVMSLIVNFGQAISDKERTVTKALGGGALYDMGCYMVKMATMVFSEAPISTHTHGFLNEDGVDETYTTTMLFPGNAVASLVCTYMVEYQNDMLIVGTKGRLRIPSCFWAPTKLEWTNTKGEMKRFEFDVPKSDLPFNFGQSWSAMYYQAEAVRQAINEGKQEHALMSWKETELIAKLMDEARHDLGMVWVEEEEEKK